MKTKVRVVLNMNRLSIPEKIAKAKQVAAAITSDPVLFPTPGAVLTELNLAITELNDAYLAAADGGKSKTAFMHDKEAELMEAMHLVGNYVEKLTKADAGIAHLAGLDLRQTGNRQVPEFTAKQLASGAVQLQTKAREETLYKWQYSSDPLSTTSWVSALTTRVSKTSIGNLAPGFYWFRVVFMDASGEYAGSAMRLAVN